MRGHLRTSILFFAAAILGLSVWGWREEAVSNSSKISQSLRYYKKAPTSDILVYMKAQADLSDADNFDAREDRGAYVYQQLTQTARQSQKNILRKLKGHFNFRSFHITNMVAVYKATPKLIEQLAKRDDVLKISGNKTFKVVSSPTALLTARPKGVGDNLQFVKADQVWKKFGTTGEGIVVAGQDTGVEWEHPALIRNYRGSTENGVNHTYNWHDSIHHKIAEVEGANPCGYDTQAPCDDDKHGTHTLGTVAGSDGGDYQIGMAPGAQWIACRNMDSGYGRPETYIECFEYFLAPWAPGSDPKTDGKPSLAPNVINNSWGCPDIEGCEGEEILPVLKAMKAAGIMVVASAGNAGPGCATINDQPASHSLQTYSVGALDHRQNKIASFSSRGPSLFDGGIGPDIVAPGVNILSSVPGKRYAQAGWSGTSMAGPHVAGAVALLWSAVPELIGEIDKTSEILSASATPIKTTETCGGVAGSEIPNNTFGYGSLNIEKAIELAKSL